MCGGQNKEWRAMSEEEGEKDRGARGVAVATGRERGMLQEEEGWRKRAGKR